MGEQPNPWDLLQPQDVTEPPDHYALVSYLIELYLSQSSTLMPLHSTTGYQSV